MIDLVKPQRILVVGAGHVGLYAALRLSKKLRSREAEVTVVDPQPHMTYQPFLPEAAAGNISPRHAVVPLRRELRNCHIVAGAVTPIEHARKTATVQPIVGPPREIEYDHIIVAPGSVSRTLPIPGLREHGIGFKTIGEAIYLRNHVLDRLDVAAATTDPETRKRALTFVFVGGGYAGIEALAEMEDMARDALQATTRSCEPTRCTGCWSRRPSGSCPRSTATWARTPCRSCSSATWTSGWAPGWSPASTAW